VLAALAVGAAGSPVVIAAQSSGPFPEIRTLQDTLGENDFDFEIGSWRTHLRLLADPLSGSSNWVEYEGTSVVKPILEGSANVVELDVAGESGRIRGLSLRLYDPKARQWSLHFANIASGRLTPPVIGEFRDGVGVFYGVDTTNGRNVLVRFVISHITPTSARFEQSYSDDGGEHWEVNWISVDTRIEGDSSVPSSKDSMPAVRLESAGMRDHAYSPRCSHRSAGPRCHHRVF
jgi:hypothetical protein